MSWRISKAVEVLKWPFESIPNWFIEAGGYNNSSQNNLYRLSVRHLIGWLLGVCKIIQLISLCLLLGEQLKMSEECQIALSPFSRCSCHYKIVWDDLPWRKVHVLRNGSLEEILDAAGRREWWLHGSCCCTCWLWCSLIHTYLRNKTCIVIVYWNKYIWIYPKSIYCYVGGYIKEHQGRRLCI